MPEFNALGLSDEDLEERAQIRGEDVDRARQWNDEYMPPPFHRLNTAPVMPTEDSISPENVTAAE